MLKSKYASLLLIFYCFPFFAADSKPSEQSISQLLTVMETHKLLDDMMGQLNDLMKNSIEQGLKGHTVTPDEQNIIDSMRAKTVALLKQEMNWESLEPFYMQIYRESFTQEEVDGMLTFYKTSSGQAVIKKLPIVMQKTMAEMQRRMGPLHQKLQELQKETLDELKAKNNIK